MRGRFWAASTHSNSPSSPPTRGIFFSLINCLRRKRKKKYTSRGSGAACKFIALSYGRTLVVAQLLLNHPNTFLPNSKRLFLNSNNLFSNSKVIFPNSKRLFPNSKGIFPNSMHLFPNSMGIFYNSKGLFQNSNHLFSKSIPPQLNHSIKNTLIIQSL